MIIYSYKMQTSIGFYLLTLLVFLLFLPHFHLFLIFIMMGIGEWMQGFLNKLEKLIISLYELFLYVFQTPLILIGMVVITFLTKHHN